MDIAVISCRICGKRVPYNRNAPTRPLYCKKHEKLWRNRLMREMREGIFHDLESELRRPQTVEMSKTRQVKLF